MRILNEMEVLQELAKALNKPCMYISNLDNPNWKEVERAAPYLKFSLHGQCFIENHAILIFDDETEMETVYKLTVGDDGPTELNRYNGDVRVYAITCSANGELLNENT